MLLRLGLTLILHITMILKYCRCVIMHYKYVVYNALWMDALNKVLQNH